MYCAPNKQLSFTQNMHGMQQDRPKPPKLRNLRGMLGSELQALSKTYTAAKWIPWQEDVTAQNT